ncbi:MAG: hypothetical protein E7361_01395 [Clostridiales bacterium]|nr:hypothetical protein [Clostridiales bacterium]
MSNKYEIRYDVTEDYINQMIELDKQSYSGDNIGERSRIQSWLNSNKDIYTMLLCDGKVVGYINFMPITKECFDRYYSGKISDCEITGEDVCPFIVDKDNYCLFTSIVVSKSHRFTRSAMLLWQGFCNKINKLQNNGIHISRVIMDCVTDIGEKCAIKYLNAQYVTKSPNGKIYEGQVGNK